MTKHCDSAIVAAVLALLSGCTTYVQPASCDSGSTACAGLHDARFCEYRAVVVEGSDCPRLDVAASKPFCVVTTHACIDTNYSVSDRDCRVTRYERLMDDYRDECPRGAPMFVSR